ncbi:MAG: helix-turn-helix transcriptional regulator [Clostridiales bacterium]|nr:helix-turn-helix transcriptional regulator [Clostridiales bacterium]
MAIEKKQLLKEMGQRYFEARKTKGLTQEEAAEIANVTQQAISDAELGKSFLSPYSMLNLCTAYGISCDYLMTGEISDKDIYIIDEQIRQLDTATFNHYKGMTEHFIAAVLEQKKNND